MKLLSTLIRLTVGIILLASTTTLVGNEVGRLKKYQTHLKALLSAQSAVAQLQYLFHLNNQYAGFPLQAIRNQYPLPSWLNSLAKESMPWWVIDPKTPEMEHLVANHWVPKASAAYPVIIIHHYLPPNDPLAPGSQERWFGRSRRSYLASIQDLTLTSCLGDACGELEWVVLGYDPMQQQVFSKKPHGIKSPILVGINNWQVSTQGETISVQMQSLNGESVKMTWPPKVSS